MMKRWIATMVLGIAPMLVLAAYNATTETFDGQANGTLAVSGWAVSDSSVVVTDAEGYGGSGKSVLVPTGQSATNNVADSAGDNVWTEFRMIPALGAEPTDSPETSSSTVFYFNADGYLVAYYSGDWNVCSNDIWGSAVTPVTAGDWVDVAIRQNYTDEEQVLILNDQILVQDAPFSVTKASYGTFAVINVDSNAYFDDVRITSTGFEASRYSADRNDDPEALGDAAEINTYGYAARTLTVGDATADYQSINAALADYRARDTLSIDVTQDFSGETVTIDKSGVTVLVTFTGGTTLTVSSLTIASGTTVSFPGAVSMTGALAVNGTASFSGAVSAGSLAAAGDTTFGSTLTLSGALGISGSASVSFGGTVAAGSLNMGAGTTGTLVSSATMTISGTATVAGSLVVSSSGVLNTDAITISGDGTIAVTTGNVNDSGSGLDLTGTFTLDNTWGTAATMGLEFTENWETYAADTPVSALGYRGWGVSGSGASGVLVKSGEGVGSSKAVLLPDGSVLTNRINSAGALKVWTDYQLRPALGAEPSSYDDSGSSFLSYADTNGFLVVKTTGGWQQCDTNYMGGAAAVMSPSTYTRVTLCTDYGTDIGYNYTYSLFVAGELVLDAQAFPGLSSGYSSFQMDNSDGNAYLDNLTITETFENLTSFTSDLDNDGRIDAVEINQFGSVWVKNAPPGSLFRFL